MNSAKLHLLERLRRSRLCPSSARRPQCQGPSCWQRRNLRFSSSSPAATASRGGWWSRRSPTRGNCGDTRPRRTHRGISQEEATFILLRSKRRTHHTWKVYRGQSTVCKPTGWVVLQGRRVPGNGSSLQPSSAFLRVRPGDALSPCVSIREEERSSSQTLRALRLFGEEVWKGVGLLRLTEVLGRRSIGSALFASIRRSAPRARVSARERGGASNAGRRGICEGSLRLR